MTKEKSNKSYRPGFFCALFWVICWAATLTGIGAMFFFPSVSIVIWSWSIAALSAIISYIIRTVEKSRFDGRWSWHWFD
ncbi:MAG: hypothetical protein E7056_02790 [Lentisphaerae bacterium]|nr:hypothetical protein [Lentisphaerota bacterium]